MTTYHTDNIAYAAALRLYGFPILNVEIEGRKAIFHFEHDAVMQHVNCISTNNLPVQPLKFHQELRRLSGLARSMTKEM